MLGWASLTSGIKKPLHLSRTADWAVQMILVWFTAFSLLLKSSCSLLCLWKNLKCCVYNPVRIKATVCKGSQIFLGAKSKSVSLLFGTSPFCALCTSSWSFPRETAINNFVDLFFYNQWRIMSNSFWHYQIKSVYVWHVYFLPLTLGW